MIRRLMVFATTVFCVLVATPLEAQRGPPMGRRGQDQSERQSGERAQLERRVRAQMGEMMQRRLGLTEEESASLSEIAEEFMPLRRALARDEQAVRRRVEALTLEAPTDDAEASELLARLVDLRRQDTELFVQEQDRMLEVLTPRQVLQMHALREELGERIRRLRRGRGNSGGNGTPGRHQLGDDVSER